jgi:hypothetical protein
MAGVLLRNSFRSKDHFLRLANSTLLELSKRGSHGLKNDPYSALGVFAHSNAASAVINQLVTWRQFSSNRSPLYSVETPLKPPRESVNQKQVLKKNDTTVSRSQLNVLSIRFFKICITAPPPASQPPFLKFPFSEQGGWSYDEVVNIANSLSVFRLISGPVIGAWIIQGQVCCFSLGLEIVFKRFSRNTI